MSRFQFGWSRLIKGLSETVANELFGAGEVSTVEAGTFILREGQPVDKLYILLSGTVEVLLSGVRDIDSAIKLADIGPGEIFGEFAFVDRKPASATIRAVSDVTIFGIELDVLQNFLDENSDTAIVVYRNLNDVFVERLRASNAELDSLAFSL